MTNVVSGGSRADLCRLTVLADNVQVDLALPAGAPLVLLIPEIVAMIDLRRDAPDAIELRVTATEWTLGRLGHSPLDPTGTLGDLGVRDGELLVLQAADRRAPAPLFDDLMHSVASIESKTFPRWTPTSARVTGSVAALALTLIGTVGLLVARFSDDGLVGMVLAAAVAALLVVAGTVVARVYRDDASAVTLWGAALAPSFAAGALVVPGVPGAPSLLLGAVTCGAVAVLAARASGTGAPIAVATTAVATAAAAAATVAVLTALPPTAIGAAVTAGALVLLAAAPRLSMLLAKLPLPPVPSPGSPLDTEELPDAGPLPSFVGLEARATRARRLLTGLVAAAGVTTVAAALTAAAAFGSGGIAWPGVTLAVVAAVVLMLRGRTYASLAQAGTLIGSGTAILLLLLTGAAVTDPALAPIVFAVAALGVGVALAFGVLAPRHDFSPVQRRAVELLDYAAIAAILPLACWVGGLFAAMRGL
ncbi:type VII secretion integral membrane protein EccD [Rhodococcus sp. NPDC058532]|uniref:type VII secretion integral membrane protein EccD n=1 Tax=Rhodococcus sp. NPDC058532 TaxID=3346540 RepID=UPI003646646A